MKKLGEALAADRGELRGRLLLSKAQVYEALGELEESTAALCEAASLIDANREPRIALGVQFQLLVNLCLQDRAAEAEPRLGEVQDLAERLGKELDLVRMVWLQGKIAVGLGRTEEALVALRQVRREFATRGMAFDYALVSLDLSLVLLKQGRIEEVRTIAEEMLAIFREQEVQREALAALRVFYDAAKRGAITAELARRIILFLRRAQYDPELRFDPQEETEAS